MISSDQHDPGDEDRPTLVFPTPNMLQGMSNERYRCVDILQRLIDEAELGKLHARTPNWNTLCDARIGVLKKAIRIIQESP